jgi:hypothetical protein
VYLSARDGAGLSVSTIAPAVPDAIVTMTRDTFDRLLRGEPADPGARPSVRGDRRAVDRLKEWTDRAQGLPPAAGGQAV